MGLRRDLTDMVREYQKDPKGQYRKNLEKLCEIGVDQGMTPSEIVEQVVSWAKRKAVL